jgi:hypothetical protein
MPEEFPGNSHIDKEDPLNMGKPKDAAPEAPPMKKVEQITSGSTKRRKKPLGKRFSGMFFGGDARTAGSYVLLEVMIPAAKDMLVDAGSQVIERMIYGESRRGRRSGATTPYSGPSGYMAYNRYSSGPQQEQPRAMSRRGRAVHDFDEIILETRSEAEATLEQMYEFLSRYDVVSVGDLYGMVGIKPTHVDNKWGWTDLRGSAVSRLRGGGFLLDLPEPKPI